MSERTSFLFHLEYERYIDELSDEETGALIKGFLEYIRTGEVPELDGKVKMAFLVMQLQYERDDASYQERCETNRKNGSLGGRPSKKDENRTVFLENPKNRTVISVIEEKPKKPDEEEDEEEDKEEEEDKDISISCQQVVDDFHSVCISLPRISVLTQKRKRGIKTLHKNGINFKELFAKTEASDFLTGRDGKWLNCTFDWLMKYNNALKVIEGSYANRGSPTISSIVTHNNPFDNLMKEMEEDDEKRNDYVTVDD